MTQKIFKSSFYEKLKLLIIPMMFLTLGVGQMWGVEVHNGKFYFDGSNFTTTDYVMFVFKKCSNDPYSEYCRMNRVGGNENDYTNLYYYHRSSEWSGIWYIGIIGATSQWDSGNHCATLSDAPSYTNDYNGSYDFKDGNEYYIYTTANQGGTLTPPGSTGVPTKVQTVVSYLNGSEAATSPAQIQIASYYKSGDGAVAGSTATTNAGGSNTTSFTCIITAKTTLSVSSVASGKYFVGWYKTDGTLLSTSTSYTYYASDDNTIHARFETRHSVTVNAGSNGTITTPAGGSGSTVTAGYYTSAAIVASANTGYYFTGWTKNNNNVTIASTSSASTSVTATGTATVTANFAPIWAICGSQASNTDTGTDGFGGWATSNNNCQIENISTSGSPAKTYGYKVVTLEANKDYQFKMRDRSNSQWYGNNTSTQYMLYTPTEKHTNWGFNTSGANCGITTAGAGDYTFTWNLTDKTLTVTYPTSYTVTYGHGTGGSTVSAEGSVSGTVATTKYVAAGENVTFTQSAATGYTFKEWNTQADGNGTPLSTSTSYTISSISADKTVYAIYTPNPYTVTFDINSGDTWASDGTASVSGGGVRTMTMTYDATVSGTCPTPVKNGYVFKCWSTDPDLWEGKYLWQYDGSAFGWYHPAAYSDYISTDGKWKKASNVTLYAHYYPVSFLAIDFEPSSVVPSGEVTATVRFNPFLEGSAPTYNPEGEYTLCYTLTTATGIALQVQPIWDQNDEALTVTFNAPGSPGDYTLDVKLLAGTGTDCDETPIEDYQAAAPYTFEVEEMNPITITYECGGVELRASSTTRATWSNRATVTAPNIPGMQFDHWESTNCTMEGEVDHQSTATTVTVYAFTAGSLKAVYTQGSLFFKDTKGWVANPETDSIYIYFYSSTAYWTTSSGNSEGTGSNNTHNSAFHSGPFAMTLLEGTEDVYYYAGEAPAYAAVAFSKEKMMDYNYFAGPTAETDPCHVVYVNAFESSKPMIVPIGNGALWNKKYARYYAHDLASLLPDWGYDLRGDEIGWSPATEADKHKMKAPKLGDLSFSTQVYYDNAYTSKAWKLYNVTGNTQKCYGLSGDPKLTYTSNTTAALENHDADGWNLAIQTNIAGFYTYTLVFGTDGSEDTYSGAAVSSANGLMGHMKVKVTYPVDKGDFRLIYTGGTGMNPHPGNVIKKRADGEDIVSMFVPKNEQAKIKVQACTAVADGSVTWTAIGSCTALAYADGVSFTASDSAVYNFTIAQDEDKVTKITNVEKYNGRFYVRTNCVNDDKWNYWDSKDEHAMTYSDYSTTLKDADMRFSHYYVDDLHGSVGSPINIRFTVATDYSEAICDTVFDGDASGKWKDYFHSESMDTIANVRFTYDQARNKIWRAYTVGPANSNYMVLRSNGSDVFAVDGSGNKGSATAAVKFADMNNWVYQADVYANPNSYIKLTAYCHGQTQYLRGINGNGTDDTPFTADDAEMLFGGSGEDAHHMRVTYDFKTDRMMTSWMPSDAAVSSPLDLKADVLLLRTHQAKGASITFSGEGELTNVETAYGVMEFKKDTINDISKSRYHRNLYWISFPFDVKLSDVFGFGEYGKHWMIEYYDGKGRAQKGYWADSEPNWKFVTKEVRDEFVLNANEGYVLALALSQMEKSSDIWNNDVTSVYLYFPSANKIGSIVNVGTRSFDIDTVGYQCKINRGTTTGNRTIKDSHWHCIGVPSFAESTRTDAGTTEPTEWTTKIPYIYKWNDTDNTLSVNTSSNFKFEAMKSYLIQYSDNTMSWTSVTNNPSSISRRKVEGQDASFYEWNLNLMKGGVHQDHTYIRMTNDENVTEGFDFGQDLSKEFNSGSNIYTFVGDEWVAGNVMPLDLNTTKTVAVGVNIESAGDYTFSMPEGTSGIGAILIDNVANTRTNLALTDYTVQLGAGQIDGRFVIEISAINSSTTNIENVSETVNGASKRIVDGKLYIIKDEKVFDATGARVQ